MYSFESVVKFIEIITAPTSRSNLKFLIVDFDLELNRCEKVRRTLRNLSLHHHGSPLTIIQTNELHVNLQHIVMSQSLSTSLVSGIEHN